MQRLPISILTDCDETALAALDAIPRRTVRDLAAVLELSTVVTHKRLLRLRRAGLVDWPPHTQGALHVTDLGDQYLEMICA